MKTSLEIILNSIIFFILNLLEIIMMCCTLGFYVPSWRSQYKEYLCKKRRLNLIKDIRNLQ